MSEDAAALELARREYRPKLPSIFRDGPAAVEPDPQSPEESDAAGHDEIRQLFERSWGQPVLGFKRGAAPAEAPLRVGVVLSGGQAPGGHNVITGLHDALAGLHGRSALVGFVGGPRGVIRGDHRALDAATLGPYRNTGGFDLIGSGRDKIESDNDLHACDAVCRELSLDGLVVIGGDDSNTNAAVLAEHFLRASNRCAVVGVPKTIDGDLRNDRIELSFGFDTATKVYASLIGNVCRDALSAGKYWHFIKLMGRSASHVTLECALQTRPNLAWIGEEVRQRGQTLGQIVETICDAVCARAARGVHHGVCLVPEGLIEFVPEVRTLIAEINDVLGDVEASATGDDRRADIAQRLSPETATLFASMPESIQRQLVMDRDAHGNVQVSLIQTETLLVEMVRRRLAQRRETGGFSGSFKTQTHFFGYEGRCAAPSNFDADYTYALGHVAAVLVRHGRTGYIATVRGLTGPAADWRPAAVPLVSMIHLERREGAARPVIAKALVDLRGVPFRRFAGAREAWAAEDHYRYPGPIQYFGPAEIVDAPSLTLRLEHGER